MVGKRSLNEAGHSLGRAAWHVVFAGMILIAAGPTQAQNLGDLIRNALNPAASRCKNLLEWVRTPIPVGVTVTEPDPVQGNNRRAMAGSGQSLDGRLAYLLTDEVFGRRFGKNYEQLTPQDFREFQTQTASFCVQSGEFTPAEWQAVQSVWYQPMQANFVRAKQARQAQQEAAKRATESARTELNQLAAELKQATAQNTSLDRLKAIKDRARSLYPAAGPEFQQAFDGIFQQVAQTVGLELMRLRVQDALAQATGGEHLGMLMKLRQSVSPQTSVTGVGLNPDDPAMLSLQRRERELAAAAADAERRDLATFADGLPGLEAGVRWYQRFQSRWGSSANAQPPELAAVDADFRKRRLAVLSRSGPLLTRAVQQTTTIAEAQSSIGRYTLSFEASDPSVQAMEAAVAERIRLVERNDALGHATAAGPAPAAPTTPAARATEVPANQAGNVRSGGEPSEEMMYDLVRAKFEKAAARVKGLYDQCAGGGNGAPVNGMMCLGLNLQRGVTGGAGASPTRILKFSKIDCQKSSNMPGYNCEYEIQTDSAMDKQFQSWTGFQVDKSGLGQGRFVRKGDGTWLMISD